MLSAKLTLLGIYCELLTFAVVELFTPDFGSVALSIQQHSVGQHLSLCRRGRLHEDKVGDAVDSNTMMTCGGRCDLCLSKARVRFLRKCGGWLGWSELRQEAAQFLVKVTAFGVPCLQPSW
jgi:hypothetical protein